MIGRETRMLLRHYLEQGASKSALARQLVIGRDTIHRWIRSGDLDRDLETMPVRYGAHGGGAHETRRLQSHHRRATHDVSPVVGGAAAGGDPRRWLRGQLHAAKGVRAPGPPHRRRRGSGQCRFETPAGRQAQVDFASRFSFPWGVRYALLVVLGYSRVLWCRFYPRQDMRTLNDGLAEAFRAFGGVPQELLFDQMKAVITRDLRLQGGALVRNLEFLRFAHHWSFTPARVSALSCADQGESRATGTAISGTISSTAARSSTTPIWISSDGSGSTMWPTCACTGRHASGRGTVLSATSACSCSRWPRVRIRHSCSRTRHAARGRSRRPGRGSPSRSVRSRSTPVSREGSHEDRAAVPP